MRADWQNIIALALVAAAALYVAWRTWGMVRQRGSGCGSGGCGTCSQNDAGGSVNNSLPLVELKPPANPPEGGKPRI